MESLKDKWAVGRLAAERDFDWPITAVSGAKSQHIFHDLFIKAQKRCWLWLLLLLATYACIPFNPAGACLMASRSPLFCF